MKFLLQEPAFSPQRPHADSISAPNEALQPGVLVSTQAVSTEQGSAAEFSASSQQRAQNLTANYKAILKTVEHLSPRPNESDPTGLSASVPGAKLDKGKVDVLRGAIQYFPKALEAVAHVSELGARKYSWMGWKSVPDGIRRYGAALARHLVYEADARDTGAGGLGADVLHAAQVAWNALARLELIIKEEDEKIKQS